jgi:DNA-binding SARP family transcriptional activator
LILGCFIVGCVALRFIVIRGTFMDTDTTVKWSEDRIDLYEARNAMQKADFDGATRILNRLVERQPHYAEAHRMLGRIYLQRGDRQKAFKHYEIAEQYWPGDEESKHAVAALRTELTGQQGGSANRNQPVQLGTNSTSAPAGSGP